jgi:hypothetical protein
MVNLQELEIELAPATNHSLAPINQIHVSLLKSLDLILKNVEHKEDESTLTELMTKIRWGHRVEEQELPPFKDPLIHQKIKHQFRKTNTEYEIYCTNTYNGSKDILATYRREQRDGASLLSYWRRYRRGYSYKGRFPKHKSFIRLIDRFALMDTSGQWIELLQNKLMEIGITEFHYTNQMHYLQYIYAIFQAQQDEFFSNRKKEDELYKKKLFRVYLSNHLDRIPLVHESPEAWFKKYYDHIVYNKHPDLTIPRDFGKLTYDLKQLRDEIEDQTNDFTEQSKCFKKAIHHLAQELGLPSQIKNRKKILPQLADSKEEQEQQEEQEEQQTEYQSFYYVEHDLSQCKDIIDIQQQDKRKIKSRNKKIAIIGANTSSVGEAAIAVTGILSAISFLPAIAVILVVGFSAWYINRLLFKNDSEDCLNALFLKKQIDNNGVLEEHRLIFLDKNNKPISATKKILICTLGALTFFTGLVSAALNFVDTFKLILLSHHTAIVILTASVAAFPAMGILIGLTCILFKVIADFIRNDRYKEIKEYLYKTFIDVPWKEMTNGEKAQHIGKCVAKTVICLTALAITAIVTVASFGVFYNATLTAFKYVANAKASNVIAKLASWVNSLITLPFQIDNSNKVMQSMALTKRHTFSKVLEKNPNETLALNHLQKQSSRLQKVEKAFVVATNLFNGLGQSCLNMTDKTVLSNNKVGNKAITSSSAFFYSALPNAKAGMASIELTRVTPFDSKNTEIQEQKNRLKEQKKPLEEAKTWRFFKKAPNSSCSLEKPSSPSFLPQLVST